MPGIYEEDLAYIHARGFAEHSIAGARAVVDRLGRAGIRAGRIVDLGCGSGAAARVYLDAGFEVLAADPSPSMIELARQIAPGADFAIAPAGACDLREAVAVSAFGEALTYVSPDGGDDLERTIPRVARALASGGLFAFDFIEPGPTLEGSRWAAGDDWAVRSVTHESALADRIVREITTFRRAAYPASELAWMSNERHEVVVRARGDVVALLESAGFDVEMSDAFSGRGLPARRVATVAVRRAPTAGAPSPPEEGNG